MKCSRMWGVPVSGLRLGGTSDRIIIVAVKDKAAIRAVLGPCDTALNGELVIGIYQVSVEVEH